MKIDYKIRTCYCSILLMSLLGNGCSYSVFNQTETNLSYIRSSSENIALAGSVDLESLDTAISADTIMTRADIIVRTDVASPLVVTLSGITQPVGIPASDIVSEAKSQAKLNQDSSLKDQAAIEDLAVFLVATSEDVDSDNPVITLSAELDNAENGYLLSSRLINIDATFNQLFVVPETSFKLWVVIPTFDFSATFSNDEKNLKKHKLNSSSDTDQLNRENSIIINVADSLTSTYNIPAVNAGESRTIDIGPVVFTTVTSSDGTTTTSAAIGNSLSASGNSDTDNATLEFSKLVAGSNHTCALTTSGELYCWGDNSFGQLGLGHSNNVTDVSGLSPVDLGEGVVVSDVVAGEKHTCALLSDATVKCWGSNESNQLGQSSFDGENSGDDPSETGENVPTISFSESEVTAIAAGYNHNCVVFNTGGVLCWGNNEQGQLGQSNTDSIPTENFSVNSTPDIVLGTGLKATSIAAGEAHTCAYFSDSSIKCWGDGSDGQLGYENTATLGNEPEEMGDNLDFVDVISFVDFDNGVNLPVDIKANGNFSCTSLFDTSIKCWGANSQGQLGVNSSDNKGDVPNEMGDRLEAISFENGSIYPLTFAMGQAHACFVANVILGSNNNSVVLCWGNNDSGQLGIGNIDSQTAPTSATEISFNTDAEPTAIAAGANHTCVLFEDNSIRCFGNAEALGTNATENIGDDAGEVEGLPPLAF